MPTAMGNYTPKEYGELEEKLRRSEDERRSLQETILREESTDRITTLAREAVARFNADEADQLAELQVAEEIVEPIKQEKVASLVDHLKETRAEEAVREVNDPAWVKKTSDEYDQMFKEDGTYRRIDNEQQSAARAAIRQDLMETRRSAFEGSSAELLDSLKNDTQLIAEVDKEMEAYEAERKKELGKEAKEQVVTDARATIDQRLAEGFENVREAEVEAWLSTGAANQYRQQRERELRTEHNATVEAEARQKIDGELLERQEIFDRYLADFTHEGVNLSAIPEGVTVSLYQGRTESKQVDMGYGARERWQMRHKFKGPFRVLNLISRGGGSYFVKSDSMTGEENPYLKGLSLTGSVIVVGRNVQDKSSRSSGIEYMLSSGDVPTFDEDTTSPEITIDGVLPCINIKVAGVSAVEELRDLGEA